MNYFISLFCGFGIALMTVVNGQLGQALGSFLSTVFIHIVGLITIIIVTLVTKASFLPKKKVPIYYYLGGVIGISTVIFTVYSFNYLTVTAILALGLFGQTIASIFTDKIGLFEMKSNFGLQTIVGIIIIFLGIFVMLIGEDINMLAVLFAFLCGITIVGNRTINAFLAKESSVTTSTLWNYITGLTFSIPTLLILGRGNLSLLSNLGTIPIFDFTGGIIGVIVVFTSIYVTPKIKAVTLSVLIFVGQVFTSIILDYCLSGQLQLKLIYGGLLAIFGLLVLSFKKKKTS